MTFQVGDRVRPTPAAVKRDRKKPSHDYSKRTFNTTGTIIGKRLTVRNRDEYNVRWDTAPGCAFSYYDQWQSTNMLQLHETVEREHEHL